MRNILAFAFLAVSTAALADPPANTIMKVAAPQEKAQFARACTMHFEVEVAQLGHFGVTLSLTPAQKPLFEAWKKSRLDSLRAWPCPPPPTGLDVPAPQRVDHEIVLSTLTLDALRKEQPSLNALYAALTPEQRTIFDGPRKAAVPPPKSDAPPPSAAPKR